ncbi:hypothetical protein BJY04DRAFT_135720 [Aspergillus karnatakaensis]|uniref:uncharacterized protein n=1 Tax=Aspergillus karnatakaensis TaxID=1810916 RepID=UPI003CCD8D7B
MSTTTMNEPPDGPSDSSSPSSSSSPPSLPVQQHQPPPAPSYKPLIILLSPSGSLAYVKRYPSIIAKIQRDAITLSVSSLTELNRLLSNESIANAIAGFVITDGSIMDFDIEDEYELDTDDEMYRDSDRESGGEALSRALRNLLLHGHTGPSTSHPHPHPHPHPHHTNTNTTAAANTARTATWNANASGRPKPWTVIHAFTFPAYAARHSLRFSKYMISSYNLTWRICGATKEKVSLEIHEPTLLKMGGRIYRGGKYTFRGVFLENVKEEDKVLRVAKDASVRNGGLGIGGQPDCVLGYSDGDPTGGGVVFAEYEKGEETDSTARDHTKYELQRVEVANPVGGWTTEYTQDDDDDDDGDDDGDDDDDDAMVWNEGQDIQIVDPEARREELEWADDELEAKTDEADGEEGSSSSSESENSGAELKADEMMLYLYDGTDRSTNTITDGANANANAVDSEASIPPVNKNKKAKKKDERPQHVADCPVAIHEVISPGVGGQPATIRGYVGFVGHIEDNRSMASLILGMCGVKNSQPLSAELRAELRAYGI